jgi:hypothetical protein
MSEKRKLHPAETIFAWLLVINGAMGFVFFSIATAKLGFSAIPLLGFALPLIGIASGVGALRGWSAAFGVGTIFYLVQCVRYYSPNWSFGVTSGFQAGFMFQPLDDTKFAFNLAAMGGVIYGVAVLFYRDSLVESPSIQSPPPV